MREPFAELDPESLFRASLRTAMGATETYEICISPATLSGGRHNYWSSRCVIVAATEIRLNHIEEYVDFF